MAGPRKRPAKSALGSKKRVTYKPASPKVIPKIAPKPTKVRNHSQPKVIEPKPEIDQMVKVKQKRTPKVDYAPVRRAYVQGIMEPDENGLETRKWLTQVELAKRFNIGTTNLNDHVRGENWMQQRLDFQETLRIEEDTRLAQELANRRVRSQVSFATTGQMLQNRVARSLQGPRDIDPKSLRSLAGALRSSQQVVEVAFGKPADGPNAGQNSDWTMFITVSPEQVENPLKVIEEDLPEIGGVVTPRRS